MRRARLREGRRRFHLPLTRVCQALGRVVSTRVAGGRPTARRTRCGDDSTYLAYVGVCGRREASFSHRLTPPKTGCREEAGLKAVNDALEAADCRL